MMAMAERASVLLIDHDPTIRNRLRRFLQHRGHVVFPLDTLSESTGVDHRQHDIVLYDLDGGGFEGLEQLRRTAPEVPVVVLAHSRNTADAIRVFKLGASDYLERSDPDPEMLEQALAQGLVQGRRWRREKAYLQSLEQTNERLRANLQELRDDEEAGRRLQFQLLPPDRQGLGPYRFSRRLWTSLYLSGDFVDYFRIDDDHTGFYMADVAGHGVSSAIVTVLLKTYMSRYLELYRQSKNQGILDPARIFTRINHNILKSGMDKHLTMFYGVLNHASRCLHYCNAGQFPYPILHDGRSAHYVESRNKPLGLFDFAEYRTRELQLPEAFTMILVSDGILELLPQSKVEGKLDYILGTLTDEHATMAVLSRNLGLDTLQAAPQDDVTLLLVQRGL